MRENCPSTAFSVFFLLVFGSNAGNNIDTVWPVPYARKLVARKKG